MALASVSRLAIFPMQDLFGLGSETRMNLPGTATGNWEWRVTDEMLSHDIQSRLFKLTEIYERLPEISASL